MQQCWIKEQPNNKTLCRIELSINFTGDLLVELPIEVFMYEVQHLA